MTEKQCPHYSERENIGVVAWKSMTPIGVIWCATPHCKKCLYAGSTQDGVTKEAAITKAEEWFHEVEVEDKCEA